MPSTFALAAPFALLLPFLGQGSVLAQAADAENSNLQAELTGSGHAPAHGDAVKDGDAQSSTPLPEFQPPADGPYSPAYPATSVLDAFRSEQTSRQVRIESRVVIRISPAQPGGRNNLLANLPRRPLSTEYEERKMDRCIPANGIAGVQTGTGNRLILFLKDERVVSLNLERACRARDFYSGFYVERNDDGQLCVDRDQLQSRSGARCEVERMRELVAVNG